MEAEDATRFSFCDKVDIHAVEIDIYIPNIVAIACEHGFRGVVVPFNELDTLSKELKSVNDKETKVLCIAAIDYPYGDMPTDVRSYSVMSAKEKGADEVEVTIPYRHIVTRQFDMIDKDVKVLSANAEKAGIVLRYVVDQSCDLLDDGSKTRIYRILSANKGISVSNSLGYFDDHLDHSDSILRMRQLKNKTGLQTKAFVQTTNLNAFSMYPKAGADWVGLNWNIAPQLIHAYEDLVQKKLDNRV